MRSSGSVAAASDGRGRNVVCALLYFLALFQNLPRVMYYVSPAGRPNRRSSGVGASPELWLSQFLSLSAYVAQNSAGVSHRSSQADHR